MKTEKNLKTPRGYAKRDCVRPFFKKKHYYDLVDNYLSCLLLPGNPTAVGVDEFTEGQKKFIVGRLKLMLFDDNRKFDTEYFDKYLAEKLKVGEVI